MSKVQQLGLTCKNEAQMEEFADRVSNYNTSKGLLAVNMEAREQSDGHWEISLEFASRAYARDFWIDPEYDVQVLT